MKPIFYIGGGKGGVGKSKLTFALINYFYDKNIPILIIDTDTSNPDVYKTHTPFENENLLVKQVNLDISDGWIELVNLADEYDEHFIIINSAARNLAGIEKYSLTLKNTLKELDREFITFWIINRQRDSVELLKHFMTYFNNEKIHVFLNNYFGYREKFSLFLESKTKIALESKDGLIMDFPELADRVADQLYSARVPVFEGLKKFRIGDKAELNRWTELCEKMFFQLNIL